MTEQEIREDFRQDLLRDAYEDRANQLYEAKMSSDIEYCIEQYVDEIQEAYDILTVISHKMYKQYGHEISEKSLLEEI